MTAPTRFDAENVDIDFSLATSFNDETPERMRWLREHAPVFWSEKTQRLHHHVASKTSCTVSKHNEHRSAPVKAYCPAAFTPRSA